jgi:hypothetical protein
VATNRAQGLTIGPRTALPHWSGERLDLGWAIDVLHPACNPAVPADRMSSLEPDYPR